MTKILKNPGAKEIKSAAKAILSGKLVVFPTETVYGLGASALNPGAVRKIYKVKGRPADNPMIVHIAKRSDLFVLARNVPERAIDLAKRFWPGPLTMVLKKSELVPKEVTAGLDTVAIRMPANRIALELIRQSCPIAAPSANRSGKPSPTALEHVLEDLKDVDIIIDGGKSKIGLESTVLDVTKNKVLRPGKITPQQLKAGIQKSSRVAKSPGMKYRHYAPKAKIVITRKSDIKNLIEKYKKQGKRVGLMSKNYKYNTDTNIIVGNEKQFAKNLYTNLRKFDRKNIDIVIVEGIAEKGLGLAIMNRLKKASSKS